MTEMALPQVEEPKKEVTAAEQQPVKSYVEVWYHDTDHKLVTALDQYLQPLYRRLGPQVERNYFGYREETPKAPAAYSGTDEYGLKDYEERKAKYENREQKYKVRHDRALSLLKHTFLFIPCVSNAFIEAIWNDMEQSSELGMLMTNPDFQIMPVVLRPTETGMMYQSQPLCTYEGHHLETACKEIASVVETIIRDYYGPDLEQKKTPVNLLFQSGRTIQTDIPSERHTVDVLMERCLTPIQSLLEQTSARMVEAQHLAIAERSTNEERLSKQLDEMEHRLTAQESERDASLLTKLRRGIRIF